MTSTMDHTDTVGEQHTIATTTMTGTETTVEAPYRCGDRIWATSPEGVRFLARVEVVKPTASGEFTVLAAVTEPRRFRSHLLTTLVGADGFGVAVRPAS
jgi:hypothetical protein